MQKTLFRSSSIAALALAPFITGCATKKFVRTTVAPIQQKVGELDATTKTQGEAIAELEKGVAKADERAQGADARAEAAAKEAALARKEAADGKSYAEAGFNKVDGELNKVNGEVTTIHGRFENLRDYKMVANESVLFKVGQWELNDEAKADLDAAVEKIKGMKNYVVELQGFTDSTGSKYTNLELSRKRADAVVRYLTTKHSIALHRVYVAGYGHENSVADNKTRDGRKQNRRVDMKVFLSGDEAAQNKVPVVTAAQTQPSN